jgi:hypothetical protein
MASGPEKLDLNLRSHGQICHGKQAHAGIAEIDAKRIHLDRLGEYLHRGIQQLAFPASPVWFEVAFENHSFTGKDTVAQPSRRAKITDVQSDDILYKAFRDILYTPSPEIAYFVPVMMASSILLRSGLGGGFRLTALRYLSIHWCSGHWCSGSTF